MKVKTASSFFRALFLTTLSTVFPTEAEVITWTNTSNDNWSVTNNWSPNQVPSTNDTAVITNDGTYTVTLNVSPTIGGLLLGGSSGTQTLATAGRILTLNGDATVGTNGVILLSGGTLSGDSRINLRGTITWNSGVLDTNASICVATNGRITMAGSSGKYWYGNVTNAGTVEWQPTGGISMNGTLYNLAAGLFDAQVDGGAILVSSTNATFINDGLFCKTNGTGNINCYAPLINNGTVDIQMGTLTLRAPSVFNSGCAFTGGGTVNFLVGTNTLNGDIYSENLTLLYSATLTGTGSFSGTLNWGGGSIGEDAAITVATNGHLVISSVGQFTKVLAGSLTNAGTIVWKPLGNLQLGGVLHNLSNAVFDIQNGNSGILASGTNTVFINDGILRRSVAAGGTSCYVPLINDGTVDVQSGTLQLRGDNELNDGSAFTGAGITYVPIGTNTINGTVYSENLELAGATLVSFGLLTGTFSWTAGTIDAVQPFNITSNSTLTIGNGANNTKFFIGNLTNAGTIIWLPTGTLQLGGVFHNMAGGLFDIHGDILLASNAPTSLVINDGIMQKSVGNGIATCGPALVNNGVVEVNSGRLACAGGYSNPTGTIFLAGGIFQNNAPIHLAGGGLTGWGAVYATVTNSATVRPSPTNGLLTITGNYVQTLAGTTAFELGGNLPGANQSRLNVSGSARLSGCINVERADGYLPAPGTDFPVMIFASRDREFDCANGFFLLGQARRLTSVYASTSLTLSTVTAPDPTEAPLSIVVRDGSALVTWPLEFTGYELYWSTNLSQTNWTWLDEVTNRFLESPPLAPEKFFRVRRP